jgi:hypothetical protein|tara:strand:+ start:296 stop:478 length:183 start_codon:yes stop_codon:yes gene_type:complete
VPCNITTGNVGDYVVPVVSDDDSIKGSTVKDPTVKQYLLSVGQIKRFLEDGRASVIVKMG